jgi:hypothetical protein
VKELGLVVVVTGLVLVLAGGLMMLSGRLSLPGDITIQRGGVTIFIPLAASVVLSLVLTVALNLFLRAR